MAKTQFAQYADSQIERNSHDDIGTNGYKLPFERAGKLPARHERLQYDKRNRYKDVIQKVVKGGFVHCFNFFHIIRLHFLTYFFAHQAGGLYQQNDDEYSKYDGVRKLC
ncbi:hypothetical protein SDC9_204400 [bioreactor metagenome]|uniref:Uncharacterized protein n=1 Tax=bioreactor metagenome TaxID=1076179 RepID=A0A645J1Y0_9ZZZZ